MIKQRAIFIGDVRFDKCPVFELNEKTGYYEMLKEPDFRYTKDIMLDDGDWLFFEVDTKEDIARMIKR
jgi:hypothetical protein